MAHKNQITGSEIQERLVALLKEGPQTRDQLAAKMFPDAGYTKRGEHRRRSTVYDGLRKLIVRNEVKKFPLFATERSRGRPQVLFCLFDGKD